MCCRLLLLLPRARRRHTSQAYTERRRRRRRRPTACACVSGTRAPFSPGKRYAFSSGMCGGVPTCVRFSEMSPSGRPGSVRRAHVVEKNELPPPSARRIRTNHQKPWTASPTPTRFFFFLFIYNNSLLNNAKTEDGSSEYSILKTVHYRSWRYYVDIILLRVLDLTALRPTTIPTSGRAQVYKNLGSRSP